ncbi:MAG: hypothetical protein H6624_13690 [Bdellovibrionaceae bacterium]|nr:hypothetical protein [Bdellovibrionales bacterium]MCB9085392.1 hypothetical protein [Pseudobdellovibrionaceae bacterium]
MQEKWRNSSNSFALGAFRLVSGTILGLTFSLIGDQIFDYGTLAFLFVIVTVTAAFMRISRGWRVVGVLVFDLICVLVGMLLRLYILIAPGQ